MGPMLWHKGRVHRKQPFWSDPRAVRERCSDGEEACVCEVARTLCTYVVTFKIVAERLGSSGGAAGRNHLGYFWSLEDNSGKSQSVPVLCSGRDGSLAPAQVASASQWPSMGEGCDGCQPSFSSSQGCKRKQWPRRQLQKPPQS